MRVVIAGASPGTLHAAQTLRTLLPQADIVLVNRSERFTQPRFISHLISGLHAHSAPIALTTVCAKLGVRFMHGAIDGIEPASRIVDIGGTRLAYDALLIDLPHEPSSAHEPGANAALPLGGESSAHAIRRHVIAELEKAKAHADPAHRTFFVVGAGPHGIEAAAHLHELTNTAAKEHCLFPEELKHIIVKTVDDGSSHVPVRVHDKLKRILTQRGIDWRTPTHVRYDHTRVTTDGHVELTNTIIWTAAPRGNRLFLDSGLTIDEDGFLLTDQALRTSDDRVFAMGRSIQSVGDIPVATHRGTHALEREGYCAAHNIAATLVGAKIHAHAPDPTPRTISLGHGEALSWTGPFMWRGALPFRMHVRRERGTHFS